MKMYTCFLLILLPFVSAGQQRKADCQTLIPLLQQRIAAGKATNLDHFNKANCEHQTGRLRDAVQTLGIALKMTDKKDTLYADILSLRSWVYTDMNELDSAIADNVLLVRTYPKHIGYLINLSFLYGETRKYADCMAVLHKAKSLDSSSTGVYANLAYYSAESGNYQNAIKYAEKGLTLVKDSASKGGLLNTLGFAQSKLISPEKGLQTIESSLRVYPRNAFAYLNKGRIYISMNQKAKACECFVKARELGGVVMTKYYLENYCR